MTDGRAPCQTEAAVGGDQGLPGDLGPHPAITQDELGKHGKDRPASGALHAPDSETTEAHTRIMGVACQRAAAITGRFVMELEANADSPGLGGTISTYLCMSM